MAEFWNRHDPVSRAAMMTALAPLVAASRTKTFTANESRAYMISLADVPPVVLEDAVLALVGRGVTWMPKPGELKEACAKAIASKRTAVFQEITGACQIRAEGHCSSFFVQAESGNGSRRCDCWMDAQRAMDRVGHPIALPPVREELREARD